MSSAGLGSTAPRVFHPLTPGRPSPWQVIRRLEAATEAELLPKDDQELVFVTRALQLALGCRGMMRERAYRFLGARLGWWGAGCRHLHAAAMRERPPVQPAPQPAITPRAACPALLPPRAEASPELLTTFYPTLSAIMLDAMLRAAEAEGEGGQGEAQELGAFPRCAECGVFGGGGGSGGLRDLGAAAHRPATRPCAVRRLRGPKRAAAHLAAAQG